MRERKIVVPPQHLFPADEWRMVEARWTPGFRCPGRDRPGALQRLPGRPWHPRRGTPGGGAGRVRQRVPRDVADHPRRGRLRVGARRPDDRQRAGRHDHRAVRRRRAAVRPDGAPARVPPRPRHAQRDPDPRAVVGDAVGQARPSAQHPARVVRAPPRGGHVLRGDAGSAGAGDHPLTGAQQVERRARRLGRGRRRERSAHRQATRSPDPRATDGGAGRASDWCLATRRSRAG